MSSYSNDNINPYLLGSTVMVGLVIIPFATMGLMSCTNVVRRRGDPARTGTVWLIVAFPFAMLGAFFQVFMPRITSILLSSRSYVRSASRQDLANLQMAGTRMFSVGKLFQWVADILVLIAITEFCGGFLYALSGTKSTARLALRIVAWVMGGILFVLAIAWLGVYNTAVSIRYLGSSSSRDLAAQFRITEQLLGAIDILLFVISACLIAYAAVAVHKYRNIPAAHNAPVLLLVAAIFNFIRYLYYVIYDGLFILPEYTLYDTGLYIWIVDAIFNNWFFLVVMALLYAMASKRAGGLWSTAQPWTAPMPAGYTPYGQQQQQYPPQPQTGYQYTAPMPPHQNGFTNGSPPPQMQMQQPYIPPQGPYQPPQGPYQPPQGSYQPPTQPHVQA